MQNFVAPKLESFIEAQWMRAVLFIDSTISIETVWGIKEHVESQIISFKMHQRDSIQNGNTDIAKSFVKSMRVIWAIL